jgi:hypothetical protein
MICAARRDAARHCRLHRGGDRGHHRTHPAVPIETDAILEVHYRHRDPARAESAVRKLERRMQTPDRPPDWPLPF